MPEVVGEVDVTVAEDPEDVAQEAFVRLSRHGARLRDPASAPAWLRVTVVNLCRSRLRHLQVARRAPVRHDRPAVSAEDLVLVAEEHRLVLAAVRLLPAGQRQVVVLRWWARLSEAETAEAMGISRGTVKSQTSRALRTLRARLEEDA